MKCNKNHTSYLPGIVKKMLCKIIPKWVYHSINLLWLDFIKSLFTNIHFYPDVFHSVIQKIHNKYSNKELVWSYFSWRKTWLNIFFGLWFLFIQTDSYCRELEISRKKKRHLWCCSKLGHLDCSYFEWELVFINKWLIRQSIWLWLSLPYFLAR